MKIIPAVEVEAAVSTAEASLRAAEKGAKRASLLPRVLACARFPSGAAENRTPRTAPAGELLPDWIELCVLLGAEGVEFLVVGGQAVVAHGAHDQGPGPLGAPRPRKRKAAPPCDLPGVSLFRFEAHAATEVAPMPMGA